MPCVSAVQGGARAGRCACWAQERARLAVLRILKIQDQGPDAPWCHQACEHMPPYSPPQASTLCCAALASAAPKLRNALCARGSLGRALLPSTHACERPGERSKHLKDGHHAVQAILPSFLHVSKDA